MRAVNGESMFGPSETWPAQIDDFIYFTSKNKIEKKFIYNNLKESILLIHSKIQKRNYISQDEYERTMEQLFEAAIMGFKKSKLETVFQNNLKKEREEISFFKKPFINLGEKALERNNLSLRISKFKETIPSYLDVYLCIN